MGPRDADGQAVRASVSLGAADVRLADRSTFSSVTIGPSLGLRTRRVALTLDGALVDVGGGAWSSQGAAQGAWVTEVSPRGWMGELGGSFGGSSFPGAVRTAQGLGAARLHWIGTDGALWGGGAAGAMYDGARWRGVRQGELGVMRTTAAWRLAATVMPSVVDDTIGYSDLLVSVGTSLGRVDLRLSGGARAGAALPIAGGDRRAWGGAAADVWLASRLVLQMGVGAYPVDATQGFPAGQYATLGLRFGERRARGAEMVRAERETRAAARTAGVRAFRLTMGDDGTVALRVHAPRATRVELQADATAWQVVALEPGGDGWWWVRLPRPAAQTLEVALRVDGGAWLAPPGSQAIQDEFGGVTGRLVVP